MHKTILITGCSSDIGRAAATLFAVKGWNVIAAMCSPEKETKLLGLSNLVKAKRDHDYLEFMCTRCLV